MSSDIPKQEFLIDDLPTTSVTIYPARAHVVRDIADVKLQPGLNEVTIYGITPAADEHSVQLDGHGAATITDMSVELVANRERFADQFSDESDDSDSDLDSGDASDGEWERSHLRALQSELKRLREEVDAAREKQSSANDQIRVLNAYLESTNAKHNEVGDITKAVGQYAIDRARLHKQWTNAKQEIERLEKDIRRKEAKFRKETKAERKTKKKTREEREKKMAQRRRERRRVRDEKAKFWPRKLYCVRLTLEAPTDTPTSSRRRSSESAPPSPLFDEKAPVSASEKTVRLSLSYVVREAFWSPRYNVSISSLDKTATITYSAEFSNRTSETWKDAKITLSTSQTSYSGLDDKVPELRPWPIFLRDRHAYDEDDHHWDTKLSPQENLAGNGLISHGHGQDHFNRYEVFGPERPSLFGNLTISEPPASHNRPPPPPAWRSTFGAPSQLGPVSGGLFNNNAGRGFGSANAGSATSAFGQAASTTGNNDSGNQQPQATGGLFGNSNNAQQPQGGGLFGGGGSNTNAQPAQSGGLFGSSNNNNNTQQSGTSGSGLFGTNNNNNNNNAAQQPPTTGSSLFGRSTAAAPPIPPEHPPTLHQEPTWEDSGMTTAYDLPGTRTLAPSPLARRHKLATLAIRDVALSYLAIPKLRKGAFLRAELRNPPSSATDDDDDEEEVEGKAGGITLLAGAAGLTLDGSFLGTTSLPRTAPGEALRVDLGVDPAVHVAYAPPALLRHGGGAQQGYSLLGGTAREAADRHARCTTITNARGAMVRVTVRDQVPVSEMERLRVEVVVPRGLWRGGGRVEGAGVEEAEAEGKGEGRWGEAAAQMKEGNVVEWTVELEKGKSCRLPLEWEVRMPGDKRIAFA